MAVGDVPEIDENAAPSLDVTGLDCPEPVLRTQQRLNSMATGESLIVVFDDPLTELDLMAWCERLGHPAMVLERTAKAVRVKITRRLEPATDAG